MSYTPEEAKVYNNFHMKYGKDEPDICKVCKQPQLGVHYHETTEDDMDDLEDCMNEMQCVRCGLELDARGTDCDCMCHQLV